MNRRRPISCFVAVFAAVLGLAIAPGQAFACRPLATYTINENEVIAEGWVESVEITGFAALDGFLPVTVTMRVLRSLKGDAPARIRFTDAASYMPNSVGQSGGRWSGNSGACGALNEDPTDKYGLVVFKWMDGQLVTSSYRGATFGSGPDDPKIERFRQHIQNNVDIVDQPQVLPEPAVSLLEGWRALAGLVLLTAAGSVVVGTMIAGGRRTRT